MSDKPRTDMKITAEHDGWLMMRDSNGEPFFGDRKDPTPRLKLLGVIEEAQRALSDVAHEAEEVGHTVALLDASPFAEAVLKTLGILQAAESTGRDIADCPVSLLMDLERESKLTTQTFPMTDEGLKEASTKMKQISARKDREAQERTHRDALDSLEEMLEYASRHPGPRGSIADVRLAALRALREGDR